MAVEALRLDELGVGPGGLPHDGNDIRGPRTRVAVRWRGVFGRFGRGRLWAGARFVGVGRGAGELDGGGVGVGLWGQV